jgi:DNA-binding CsgD family transcriptional regulator/pimeloyl-ACP methyl ester carboxylesterase
LLDLEAVLDGLGLGRIPLLADNFWSHVAVRLAVRQPQRVSALVLMHCATSFADQVRWFIDLARQNWDYFLDTQVGAVQPTDSAAEAARQARKQRLMTRTTQEDWLQVLRAYAKSDITDDLRRLKCPVLVLFPRNQQWVSLDETTRLTGLIPNARLVSVGGHGFWGEPQEVIDAIDQFMADLEQDPPSRPTTAVVNLSRLSDRQEEVLRLIAAGKTNREIAALLVLSLRTVERHVNDIYARLGLRNRSEAVAFALKHTH